MLLSMRSLLKFCLVSIIIMSRTPALLFIKGGSSRPRRREGMQATCRAKFKWLNLATPYLAVHNEIHKCVGGEVYTALPVDNEIHGAIAVYSSPKLRNERQCLNFVLHITYIRGYMPSRRLRRLDTPLIYPTIQWQVCCSI